MSNIPTNRTARQKKRRKITGNAVKYYTLLHQKVEK